MTTMVKPPTSWPPVAAAISYAASGVFAGRFTRDSAPDLGDVKGIVSRTLDRAKALGRDDLTQTRAAALAVLSVRPDLTLSQAMSGISRLQALGAI